ncbi:FAD:protein FMN transferase [Bifidobacterium indicum]|uniref:FAD:protein FMN transferase n=1 Tax=Bifidobacterium indicum TaxID=1691 RepID=UPI0030D76867
MAREVGSSSMPHLTAFPEALGTGIIINTAKPVGSGLRARMGHLIEAYESTLSRFRDDSIPAAMAESDRGGSFDFPEYCQGLFDLYDCLYLATGGALDPAVGADLVRLGYGRDMTFRMSADAVDHLGRIRGRATWGDDVERVGTTLRTTGSVQLDFGALGKGYLVDLLAGILEHAQGTYRVGDYLIDAGGDMRIHAPKAVSIAMEDPDDLTKAVGLVSMVSGSLCASAPSRRRWTAPRKDGAAGGLMVLHHIVNAIDGWPVRRVEATWVVVGRDGNDGEQGAGASICNQGQCSPERSGRDWTPDRVPRKGQNPGKGKDGRLADLYPTALADGLSTALFLVDANDLAEHFSFACATIDDNRRAVVSRGFPGTIFTG